MKDPVIKDNTQSGVGQPISKYRYLVYIYFDALTNEIRQPVKTLKEAQSYKSMIDHTVRKACIIDHTNGKIVEWWKT
jgi:hypothetical protein